MSNYGTLKAAIQQVVKTNGNNEITGALLQQSLLTMVNSLGAYFQFRGVALPSTNPGTPDENVAYICGPGTYPNFNNTTIPNGTLGVLLYNGAWTSSTIPVGMDYTNAIKESAVILAKSGYGTYYDIPNNGGVTDSFIKRDVTSAKYVLISSYVDNPDRVMLVFFDSNGNRMAQHNITQGMGVLNADTGNYDLVVPIPAGAATCAAGKLNIGTRSVYVKVVPDLTTVLDGVISNVTTLQNFAANTLLEYVATNDNSPVILNGALKDFANKFARSAYGKIYDIPESGSAQPGFTKRDVVGAQFVFISSYVDNPKRKMLAFYDSGNNELTNYAVYQNYGLLNPETNCYEICVPVPVGAATCVAGKLNIGTRSVFVKIINGDEFITAINDIQNLLSTLDFEAIKAKTDEFTIIQSQTTNLINPTEVIIGYYNGWNGSYEENSNYCATGKIKVTPGLQYTILCKSWSSTYYFRHVAFYKSDGTFLSGITSPASTFTAPANADTVIVSLYRNPTGTVIPYADYGMFVGASPTFEIWYGDAIEIPFVPYEQKSNNAIVTKRDLEENKGDSVNKALTITVTNPTVRIEDANGNYYDVATNYRESRDESVFTSEELFNFLATSFNGHVRSSTFKDDIAPAHFLNTTLGANHAQPCVDATVQNHGLTNAAVGTGWVKDGKTYYIVCIVNANTIRFLSQNDGTAANPSYTALTAGTLTNGANSLVVTSVASAQMHPASKNHSIRIVLDGETVVVDDGTYYANTVDFVEAYDVLDPYSVLQNLIANVGTTTPPVYDGNVAAHIENVYRFQPNMSVLVIANFIAKENIAFQDIMFSQAMIIGDNNSVKYYLPNSTPISGYNMTQPLTIDWTALADSFYLPLPVNRVLQFDGTQGFAIGFCPAAGVGKNLQNYTDNTFELRRNTGKVYPHGVIKNVVGTSLSPNQSYSAIMFRCPFIPETSGNRLSLFHYELNGSVYAYVDYKGSQFDNVQIDDKLNGKEITVVEAKNVELVTDIYNGGFNVNASFVSGETCFIVVKIS